MLALLFMQPVYEALQKIAGKLTSELGATF